MKSLKAYKTEPIVKYGKVKYIMYNINVYMRKYNSIYMIILPSFIFFRSQGRNSIVCLDHFILTRFFPPLIFFLITERRVLKS